MLFVGVLTWMSMVTNLDLAVKAKAGDRSADVAQTQSSFSQGSQLRFEFLLKTGETLSGTVTNAPFSGAKHDTFSLAGLVSQLEQRLQSILVCQLAQAREVTLSLGTCDIIFPFHYFW